MTQNGNFHGKLDRVLGIWYTLER